MSSSISTSEQEPGPKAAWRGTLLLWTALLFFFFISGSLCDDAPSPPPPPPVVTAALSETQTSARTSTITITTKIAYKPSMIAGTPDYTLLGCYAYSHPTETGLGVFAATEHDVPAEKLTVTGCLEGCAPAARKGKKGFSYAGVRNGSECICDLRLSPDAQKLSGDHCKMPCSGDARQSCGGRENDIVVYRLIATTSSSSSSATKPHKTSSSYSSPTATNTDTNTKNALTSSIGNSFQTGTPNPSPSNHKPVSTVAAVAGSLSAAVVVGAGLFLCARAQRRKRRLEQESYVRAVLDRDKEDDKAGGGRSIHLVPPSKDIHDLQNTSSSIATVPAGPYHRRSVSGRGGVHHVDEDGDERNSSKRISSVYGGIGRVLFGRFSNTTKERNRDSQAQGHHHLPVAPVSSTTPGVQDDLVPTTPALESGTRHSFYPSGLYARKVSISATSTSSSSLHPHMVSHFSTSTVYSTPRSTILAGEEAPSVLSRNSANTYEDRDGEIERDTGKDNDNKDGLYDSLLDEVRSGPANTTNVHPISHVQTPHIPPRPRGESSAVEWRPYSRTHPYLEHASPSNCSGHTNPTGGVVASWTGSGPGTTHKRQLSKDMMSMNVLGVTPPPTSTKPDSTLGDRAWHRRKLSAKFQPPRGGPPSMPLPPPPPVSMPVPSKPTSRLGPGLGDGRRSDLVNGGMGRDVVTAGGIGGNGGGGGGASIATGMNPNNISGSRITQAERYRGVEYTTTSPTITTAAVTRNKTAFTPTNSTNTNAQNNHVNTRTNISSSSKNDNSITNRPLPPPPRPRRSFDTLIFEPGLYDDDHNYDFEPGYDIYGRSTEPWIPDFPDPYARTRPQEQQAKTLPLPQPELLQAK
ncbi:hypothetical protein F5Y17DRAFT_461748, partial [Xylariaceae sp. FL0594]